MNFLRKKFFIFGLILNFGFIKTEKVTTITESDISETSIEYSNNISWKKVACAVVGTTAFAGIIFYGIHQGTKNMTQEELNKIGTTSKIFLNIIEVFANIFSMVAQSSNHKVAVKSK